MHAPAPPAAGAAALPGSRRASRWLEALLLLALGLLVLRPLLMAYPANGGAPGRDSGVFLYAASRILQGEIPYRDVWDHKPPAVFYVDALGVLISGGSAWGVWLLQALALAGAALLSYALMRRLFGPLVAWLASVAWVACLPALLFDGNLTEEYALPMQWLALSLLFHAERRRRYTWEGYAIGAAGALALLLRQNLVGVWLAIGLCLTLRAVRCRDWRQLQPLGPMAAAGGAIVLAVAASFAAQGALADLWDAAFRFNFAYSPATLSGLLLCARVGVQLLLGLAALALGGWMARFWHLVRGCDSPDAAESVIAVCTLGLPLEILLASVSGRSYPHYYVAWLPCCALLAGSMLQTLGEDLRSCWAGGLRPRASGLFGRRLVCTGTATTVLALVVAQHSLLQPPTDPWLRIGPRLSGEVAQYVQRTTAPGDSVLVWGAEAGVNYVAGRRSPTRFVYQYPLFAMPGYQDAQKVSRFLADIKAARPALIIDTSPTDPVVPPLDAAARQERLQGPHAFVLLPEMDGVFSYIADNYRREEMPSELGWVAYRHAGSEEDAAQTRWPGGGARAE